MTSPLNRGAMQPNISPNDSIPQSPQFSAIIEPSEPVSRSSSLPIQTHNPHGQSPLQLPSTPRDHSPFRPSSRISIPQSVASSFDDVHTGKSWARTLGAGPVEDPWLPLILTCDGGGIRGYSSLLIIKEIMHEVAVWENFLEKQEKPSSTKVFKEEDLLPCHYFDFMYGTSTGGLIATMLGRLRMPLPACLEIYKEVGDKLFGKKRSKMPLATKYDHEPLEAAVKRIVQQHCPVLHTVETDGCDWNPWQLDLDPRSDKDSEEPFWAESSNRICQSICLTAVHNQNITNAYLLRTYNHRYYADTPVFITRYNEGADRLKIWQVTRATSAAPFFFKALFADVSGEIKEFKDGGIRENNPSSAAWNEFVSIYGENREPALLLSIGTGRPNMEKDGFMSVWPGPFGKLSFVKKFAETFAVFKNMLVKYTEGESRHVDMTKLARGQHTWYKRLNVDKGLENMRLDNWEHSVEVDPETKSKRTVIGGKTLSRMEEATAAYFARTSAEPILMEYATPKVMVQQIAEKMVRHRRAREKTARFDPDRWETFLGRKLQRMEASATTAAEPSVHGSSSASSVNEDGEEQHYPAS
jgi:hypothetical protein